MAKSILVVDDSRTIQTAIQMTFAAEDVTLTVVSNGEAALQKSREGNFQVVICDHMMPGMDGYSLCEALRRDGRTAHLPVLLLTGSGKPFDEARAQGVGIDDHIAKPFDSQALIDKTMALANKPQASARSTAVMSSLAPKPPEPAFTQPAAAPDPFGATMIDPFAPPPDPFASPTNNASPFSSPFSAPSTPFAPAPTPPPPQVIPSPFANPLASPQPRNFVVAGNNPNTDDDEIRPTATLLGIPALQIQPPKSAMAKPATPPPAPNPFGSPQPAQAKPAVTNPIPAAPTLPKPPASPFSSPPPNPFASQPPVQAKPAVPAPVPPPSPTAAPASPAIPKPPASPVVPPKPPTPFGQPQANPFATPAPQPQVPAKPMAPPPLAAKPAMPVIPPAPQPRAETTTIAAPPVQAPRVEVAPVIATPTPAAPSAPAATPTSSAPAVTEDVLRQVLSQASREMIEKIVWEVVPDLAESIIREELAKIIKRVQN